MSLKLLHEPETEDPILSVVNLIDIFLVIIAALLITVAQNPMLNAFNKQDVTVITDAGKPSMEVLIKKGERIEKYKANGNIGSGDGEKAGVAWVACVPWGSTIGAARCNRQQDRSSAQPFASRGRHPQPRPLPEIRPAGSARWLASDALPPEFDFCRFLPVDRTRLPDSLI